MTAPNAHPEFEGLSNPDIVEPFSSQQQTSPREEWGDGAIASFLPLLGSNQNNNNSCDTNDGADCPLLANFSKLPPPPPPLPLPRDVIEVGSDLGDINTEKTSNKSFSRDKAETNKDLEPRLVLSLPTFPIGRLRTDKASSGKHESSFGTALLQSLWPLTSPMRDDESTGPTKESVPTLDFSFDNILDAPTAWLRHMQAVFKELLHNRVEEWKELLATYYHDVDDAQKLVTCLTKCQKKLLVSCRGHTTVVNVTTRMADETSSCTIGDGNDETESHASSILECTERGTTQNKSKSQSIIHLNSLPRGCVLKLELLVKIRKGPRSFATSCYTMHFVVPIIATCAVHPSDGLLTYAALDCDPLDILRPMQQRVEQIVLKAMASHASETPGMAPRWKNNPTFLSKLWHVQNKNANLAPLARGFCSSSASTGSRLGRSDDSSVSSYADISIQTSSTLSSLGSRSASTIVPADIMTTKEKGRSWRHSLWFRGLCQVLSFVLLLFAASLVLQLHSIGNRAWNSAVKKKSFVTSTLSRLFPPRSSLYPPFLPYWDPTRASHFNVSFTTFHKTIPISLFLSMEAKLIAR